MEIHWRRARVQGCGGFPLARLLLGKEAKFLLLGFANSSGSMKPSLQCFLTPFKVRSLLTFTNMNEDLPYQAFIFDANKSVH